MAHTPGELHLKELPDGTVIDVNFGALLAKPGVKRVYYTSSVTVLGQTITATGDTPAEADANLDAMLAWPDPSDWPDPAISTSN